MNATRVKRMRQPPPAQPARPRFLTVNEVAAVLRRSPTAVRKLIYAGKLPGGYLAGRTLRVKTEDLEAFIATEWRPA